MMILSGDIGGTYSRLQLTEFTSLNKFKITEAICYKNDNYYNFVDVIDAFFKDIDIKITDIEASCFGIAGPIIGESVVVANFPWVIKSSEIKSKLESDKVELINDFTAIGYGLEIIKNKDLVVLQPGKKRENSVRAYLGAGTGFGVGFISYHNDTYTVHSSEGGHIDFAPTDSIQIKLLQYLTRKYHRISIERLLSGYGLINIYNFVRDSKIFNDEENPSLRFLIKKRKYNEGADIAASISEYATKHKDILAMRALDIFVRIYGSVAGNLAVTFLPFNGLYIAGGIAPKILSQLKDGSFLEMFCDKGRLSEILCDIPVYVVLNENIGLNGATICCARKFFK